MALERFRRKQHGIDYLFALAIFLLVIFGIIMIFSAGAVISYEELGNSYGYALKQITSLGVGIVVWIFTAMIDYRFWQKYATHLLITTLVLLVAVFIPGIGIEAGGAHRWIDYGISTFQPTEIIKLTFILYLSAWLAKKGDGIKDFVRGFVPFLLILSAVVFLIMEQPDMGTMSVIAAAATTIFFVSGAPLTYITLYLGGAAVVFWALVKSAPYRMQRFLVFLDTEKLTQGPAYHINQALLAIGSGGWLGLGFGQSQQKYLFLPEPHTDSIFAIISEELGFTRTIFIILLFVFIGWRGYQIAMKAPDSFSRLVATGITTWFIWQAFVNIGAMLSMVPLTGVPLPFISFGGTALVMNLAAVGILLNISRQTTQIKS